MPTCRGRLYVQAGVPSRGPALVPGAVAVRPTGDVRGNGAFAELPIPTDTYLGDYTGDLLDRAAFYQRYPDGVVSACQFSMCMCRRARGRTNVCIRAWVGASGSCLKPGRCASGTCLGLRVV